MTILCRFIIINYHFHYFPWASFTFSYLYWASPSQWTQSTCCCPWGCTGQTQRFRSWAATWRRLGWKPRSPLAQPDPPAAGLAGNQARWADHRLLTGTAKREAVKRMSNGWWDMNIHNVQPRSNPRVNTSLVDKKRMMMLTQCLLLLRDAVSISQRKLGRQSWLREITKLFETNQSCVLWQLHVQRC